MVHAEIGREPFFYYRICGSRLVWLRNFLAIIICTTRISNNSAENLKEDLKMENVYLARVDDRLIHGQVMTAWMKTYPAKQIVIIDDEVVKDSFMINVLTMAAPAGVKVRVFGVEKAATLLKKGVKNPTILLAKIPITY